MNADEPAFPAHTPVYTGMTKREYAAIHIASAICTESDENILKAMHKLGLSTPKETVAKCAVSITDALFVELDKKGGA